MSFDMHIRRDIARIAVPVGLEMVFQLVLGVIDQLIVGALGAVAIAAVGLSNSVISVASFTLTMLGTGTAILVARAQGGGQTHAIGRISSVALLLAVVLALALALPWAVFATPFLFGIGAEPQIVAAGQGYFQVVALTLPLAVIGAVASATLRALGRARVPMITTMIAVSLNTLLGYVLVFGLGPFPALGVAGAAWATLAAQATKAALLLSYLYGRRSGMRWELPSTLAHWRRISRALLEPTLPLAAKELFWSGGMFLYTLLFALAGTSALAASQIAATLEAVFIVASIGLMTAATILIGQAIGAGDAALAHTRTRALLRTGALAGLACSALYLGTIALLPIFYPHVGAEVLQIAFWCIVVNSLVHSVKVRNMILVGILPSGGDVRGLVVGDIVGTCVIGLPLAYLLGFSLGLGAWGILIARVVEEIVKTFFFGWRVGRFGWGERAAAPVVEPAGG
jgi:MATE family, multidrug efflux pump